MPNHSSQQAFGSECKDVCPAAVIRTVSGTEELSCGKVSRFPTLSALGKSPEVGHKEEFESF